MRGIPMAIWFLFGAMLCVGSATKVDAQISVDLAKKCQALMVKAHPTKLYTRSNSEAEQRAYFRDCISKNGDMPEASEDTGHPPQSSVKNKD